MHPRHSVSVVLALVALACNAPTEIGSNSTVLLPVSSPAERHTIRGMISVIDFGQGQYLVTMRPLNSPGEMTLVGPTSQLAKLHDMEVDVHGTYDALDEFVVEAFAVRAVRGIPARDGVLIETFEGYALRLANWSLLKLPAPPARLLTHVGQRVWIAGVQPLPYIDFGPLE